MTMTSIDVGPKSHGAGLRPPASAPRSNRRRGDRLTMAAMLMPSVILLLVINGYPILVGISQALHNGTLINSGDYVGLSNFREVLGDSTFWGAVRFTSIFTVVGVFGSWVVGLALAMVLRTEFPGRSTFKVLLMLPWVVPIVVSATSWQWLTATQTSPMSTFAEAIGLGQQLFLADPTLAKVTVCLYKVWVSFPFMMLLAGSALESVDHHVYEAARVDGASRFQMFRFITLPMIARTSYVGWILMAIFCVNDFPTIFLLTGGGPVNATQTLMVMAYREVFQSFDTGVGVSISLLMTAVLVVVSVFLFRRLKVAVQA